MRRYFAPGTLFAMVVIVCLALAGALVWLATQQAWLGLRLDVDASGHVVIERVAETGPVAQAAPGALAGTMTGSLVGARLVSLAPVSPSLPGASSVLTLEANDLIEEPDALGAADTMSRFFDRQDQISKALRSGPVTLDIEQAGLRQTITVQAAPKRPLVDLPLKLWLQLFVALTGALVGAWVVCLRPKDPAAWMFLVAGVGLAMASASAALYSARELALSQTVFGLASRANSSGSLIFGIGTVTLFLLYPRRIVPRAALWVPTAAISAAIAYVVLVDWPQNLDKQVDFIAVVMVVLLVAIFAQVAANRRDARARAMLGWLGLSIGLGAGGFVFTSVVPSLLNLPPILEQSTAFLFFLLIYVGMAMGVLRYRLFDLATWSFGILFYGFGVALLLMLDAALIFGLSLDRAPALGIALAMVGIIYLPLREACGRWLRRDRTFPAEVLYKRITEIAHAMDPVQQQDLLQAFWTDLFNPLRVTALPRRAPMQTGLLEDGAALTIAPVGGLAGLRLDWAQQGARLFSSADLARAVTLNQMIERSLQQHLDYVEAITSERLRINRDMHDNIGVLLLGALHATSHERKDLLIRQTLSDLREIISNPDQTNLPLPQLIADLRAEITDHLEAVDINVRWHDPGLPNALLPPKVVHTLRAFLRESTSNVVRHSAASAVEVELREEDGQLFLALEDDGKGFDAQTVRLGNGFKNLAARVEYLGGAFDIASTPAGTRISARIPLQIPAEGPNIADERSAAE